MMIHLQLKCKQESVNKCPQSSISKHKLRQVNLLIEKLISLLFNIFLGMQLNS